MSNKKRPLVIPHIDQPSTKRQKITNQIISQFQNRLEQSKFNDVEFVVGSSEDQQIFAANKIVFSTQSLVFEAMLFGPLAHSTNEPISIPDIKPAAFNYLHQLFYMKQPKLTNDIVVDVLYAAQKYMINIVIQECKQTICSINNMNYLYTILLSFGQYARATFDEVIAECIEDINFLKQNIRQFLDDVRFMKLSSFVIQKIIESDLISTETLKYESIKKYCIEAAKNMNGNSWQSIFKDTFLKYFQLNNLTTHYLLSVIKKDKIISSDILLEIIDSKENVGFKLNDILLTLPQRKSLKIGDFADVRDGDGYVYDCQVIEKNDGIIEFDEGPRVQITGWQWIFTHKSITHRNGISRPCMHNLKEGDFIYVNYAYHPDKGDQNENEWSKAKVEYVHWEDIDKQIRVKSTDADKGYVYWMHIDSQNECACLNDKCQYCFRYL